MNVPTIKLICWLSALVSALGLGKYAYDWFDTIEQRRLPIDTAYVEQVLNDDLEVQQDVRQIVDYNDLKVVFKDMNWTGKPPKKPVVRQQETGPKAPVYKPIKTILAVYMIRVDTTNPGGSQADIAYVAEGKPASLKVGTTLMAPYDYAAVHSIRPGVVEFAFKDPERENERIGPAAIPEELIVKVGPDGPAVPNRNPVPGGSAAEKRGPERTQQVANGIYQLGTEDMETFGRDYQRILTEDVTTDTYWKDGKRVGVEIKSVKGGSIAAQNGAVAGDVLISINGKKVTSESEAISYVKANKGVTAWEVVVLRYGKEETVMYYSE
jgi:PDZ domain-containing protein